MAKNPLLVTDKLGALMKCLSTMSTGSVYVGVPNVKAGRKDDGEMNNATLAYIHQNGSPAQNIPARPFMTNGMRDCQGAVAKELSGAVRAGVSGDERGKRQYLGRAGMTAQNAIRGALTEGEGFEPLADSTIASRQARGRTGTRPLIDTGQLRQSITYVIED